jgi:CelD/BcsL family acetyltransferase involved in cellulose biosynthesis
MVAGIRTQIYQNHADVPDHWNDLVRDGAATPFHTRALLSAWYDSFTGGPTALPVILEASAADGTPILLMPLVLDETVGRIGFVDAGLIDNGAPVLGPGAPLDAAGAQALWRGLLRALPFADVIELTRMPARIGGRPNPFAQLPNARPSRLASHVVALTDSWEEYDLRRTRHFRKEQRRAARLFSEFPDGRFELVDSLDERREILAAVGELQRARLIAKGADYRLDRPEALAFYARLLERDTADGSVIVTALRSGDTLVAGLLAFCDGHSATIVRIGIAGPPWNRASPGRLIIEKTMAALHARGVRRIDLSIGNYEYKDELAAVPEPLYELTEPLRLAGWPVALGARARARLAASPALRALGRRMRGAPTEPRFGRAQRPG